MMTATTMMIIGGSAAALGLISLIFGIVLTQNYELYFRTAYSLGTLKPHVLFIAIGVVLLLGGLGLLAYAWLKNSSPSTDGKTKPVPSLLVRKVCPKCGKTFSGSVKFCPSCGANTEEVDTGGGPKKDNTCPFCESILPAGVAFCPACGKQVKTVAPPAPAVCPSCGGKLEKGVAFCPACGAKIKPNPDPIVDEPPAPPLYGPPPVCDPDPKPKMPSGWSTLTDDDLG